MSLETSSPTIAEVRMTGALILACPACNTLNRFPQEKRAAGNAGKSDNPLLVDF